ncbi:hypothetical protein P5673_019164, partial [Acropora cervicornis]
METSVVTCEMFKSYVHNQTTLFGSEENNTVCLKIVMQRSLGTDILQSPKSTGSPKNAFSTYPFKMMPHK